MPLACSCGHGHGRSAAGANFQHAVVSGFCLVRKSAPVGCCIPSGEAVSMIGLPVVVGKTRKKPCHKHRFLLHLVLQTLL